MLTPFHPLEDSSATAEIVVPILMREYSPLSVLDLGCNSGAWLRAFRSLGVEAIGVDGPGMGADIEHDLNEPLSLNREFGLVLCLEVAEHIEPENAGVLVESAIAHSDTVIWSAATPGQGGHQHVNEQPHSYWESQFSRLGYFGRSISDLFPPLPHDYYRRNMWEFVN